MSIEKLQAENARLKTEIEHLMIFCNSTLIPSKELQAENARLKSEVERLRIAGDMLAFHYAALGRKTYGNDPIPLSITDWLEARKTP